MAEATDEKLIKIYVEMRDKIKAIGAAASKEKAAIQISMSTIEGEIKKRLNDRGQTSFKTNAGTAFKTTKDFVSVEDHTMFLRFVICEIFKAAKLDAPSGPLMDHILSNGPWQFFAKSITKGAVKDYMDEHDGAVTPGAKYSTESVIQVRK